MTIITSDFVLPCTCRPSGLRNLRCVAYSQSTARSPQGPCGWRIHEITPQSAFGTTRDSASASDRKQSLPAT
jgi:hypothetical protein